MSGRRVIMCREWIYMYWNSSGHGAWAVVLRTYSDCFVSPRAPLPSACVMSQVYISRPCDGDGPLSTERIPWFSFGCCFFRPRTYVALQARLKQLSADQNRNMIGSHMPPEEPLTWRTSEQVWPTVAMPTLRCFFCYWYDVAPMYFSYSYSSLIFLFLWY